MRSEIGGASVVLEGQAIFAICTSCYASVTHEHIISPYTKHCNRLTKKEGGISMDRYMQAVGYAVFGAFAYFVVIFWAGGCSFKGMTAALWIGIVAFVVFLPIMIWGERVDMKAEQRQREAERRDAETSEQ
jgi:hypothetical protein